MSPMSCLNTAGFESDRVCVVGFWVWRFSIVGGGGGGGACVSVTKDLDTCFFSPDGQAVLLRVKSSFSAPKPLPPFFCH